MKITITERDWELSTSQCNSSDNYQTQNCIVAQAIKRTTGERLTCSGSSVWKTRSKEFYSPEQGYAAAFFFDQYYRNREKIRELIGTEIEFQVRSI